MRYVGEDVENMCYALLQAAEYNVDRALSGIIYVDEIDKMDVKRTMFPSLEMCQVKVYSRHY